MASPAGATYQLVASSIFHLPPQGHAQGLGALASLGEIPLPQHPIRLNHLLGKRRTYTSERNHSVLERVEGRWSAFCELEESGATPPLAI